MIVKGRALTEKSRRYRDHYPKTSIAYAYEAGYKAALRDAGVAPPKDHDPQLLAKLIEADADSATAELIALKNALYAVDSKFNGSPDCYRGARIR